MTLEGVAFPPHWTYPNLADGGQLVLVLLGLDVGRGRPLRQGTCPVNNGSAHDADHGGLVGLSSAEGGDSVVLRPGLGGGGKVIYVGDVPVERHLAVLLDEDRVDVRPPSLHAVQLVLAAGLMLDAAVARSAGVILGDGAEAEHADVGEAVGFGLVEVGGGVVRGRELRGSEFLVSGDEANGDLRSKGDGLLAWSVGEAGGDAFGGEFGDVGGDGDGRLPPAQLGPDQLLLRLLIGGRRYG